MPAQGIPKSLANADTGIPNELCWSLAGCLGQRMGSLWPPPRAHLASLLQPSRTRSQSRLH
eukprot:5571689-Alexandrium_andersonii.AAC.1